MKHLLVLAAVTLYSFLLVALEEPTNHPHSHPKITYELPDLWRIQRAESNLQLSWSTHYEVECFEIIRMVDTNGIGTADAVFYRGRSIHPMGYVVARNLYQWDWSDTTVAPGWSNYTYLVTALMADGSRLTSRPLTVHHHLP